MRKTHDRKFLVKRPFLQWTNNMWRTKAHVRAGTKTHTSTHIHTHAHRHCKKLCDVQEIEFSCEFEISWNEIRERESLTFSMFFFYSFFHFANCDCNSLGLVFRFNFISFVKENDFEWTSFSNEVGNWTEIVMAKLVRFWLWGLMWAPSTLRNMHSLFSFVSITYDDSITVYRMERNEKVKVEKKRKRRKTKDLTIFNPTRATIWEKKRTKTKNSVFFFFILFYFLKLFSTW